MKVKDHIVTRVKQEHDRNLQDLKKLNTIVRVPVMCQRFQQTLRVRSGEEAFKAAHKTAKNQLVDWQVYDD